MCQLAEIYIAVGKIPKIPKLVIMFQDIVNEHESCGNTPFDVCN